MKFSTIYFDFNGVVGQDYFFKPLSLSHPAVYQYIQTEIFGPSGGDIINRWMRADVNLDDILSQILSNNNLTREELIHSLETGCRQFRLENRLLDLAKDLGAKGVKTVLLTDNMDVFDIYLQPQYRFDQYFTFVINSFTHKLIKKEGLFEVARTTIGDTTLDHTLLIEDSIKTCVYFETLGGTAYTYTNFESFIIWARHNSLT